MSKAVVFVLSCSVLILVLFCLFCYLLNTVDPETYLNVTSSRRIDGSEKQVYVDIFLLCQVISIEATYTAYNKNNALLIIQFDYEKGRRGSKDILYPDQELGAKDNVHYGMEKVPDDYEIKTSTEAEVTWGGDQHRLYPVLIPIVKPTVGHQVRNTTQDTRYHRSFDQQKHITVMVHPAKDYRRSLEKNRKNQSKSVNEGKSTNVLLKIIDDSGQARMEVIVDSGQIHYKDRSINKLNKSKDGELHVYEIKPNNTLLYNIPEQSLKIVSDDTLKTKTW